MGGELTLAECNWPYDWGLAGNTSLQPPYGGWCDHSMDAGVICISNPAKGGHAAGVLACDKVAEQQIYRPFVSSAKSALA